MTSGGTSETGTVNETSGGIETTWSAVLSRLIDGSDLSMQEAEALCTELLVSKASPVRTAAFLVALQSKGVTSQEMLGMVRSMLLLADKVPLPSNISSDQVLDTCGTGGDRLSTLNISTIVAFVAAGAGATVCKHGNPAASSASGSADLLEALGVVVNLGPSAVAECIKETGMGFCFAPRFHPSMANVAPVRKELGVSTIFNFLGPLTNPAGAKRQLIGVSNPSMAPKMMDVLIQQGSQHTMVVYGKEGLDELSVIGASAVLEFDRKHDNVPRHYELNPLEFGIMPAKLDDLKGGDAGYNAELTIKILEGEAGPRRDCILLNAAAALVVADKAPDIKEGLGLAASSIDSGAAKAVLDKLIAVSQMVKRQEG
jgi:anthranilate phosphoribosyltransferase